MRKPKWVIVLDDEGKFMKGYNLNAFSKRLDMEFKKRYVPEIMEGEN